MLSQATAWMRTLFPLTAHVATRAVDRDSEDFGIIRVAGAEVGAEFGDRRARVSVAKERAPAKGPRRSPPRSRISARTTAAIATARPGRLCPSFALRCPNAPETGSCNRSRERRWLRRS